MVGNWIRPGLILGGVFGLLLAASPAPAEAEKPALAMQEMTVTAEKFPVSEKDSSRFVTIITAEELEETGANNLVDALRRSGGLTYKAFGPLGISHGGMNSTLYIRGLKDGELVLINGVPIQGAAGHAYDLNTIPLDQIERVEVLKGAASTLYGADAMSGVINIITKKTGKVTKFKASAEVGSDWYQNHSLAASLPNLNLGLNYQHLDPQTEVSRSFSSGYRYDTGSTDKLSANLNLSLAKKLHLDYLGSYYETGFEKIYDSGKPTEATRQKHYKNFADLRYEADNLSLKAFGTYDEMHRDEYTSSSPKDVTKNYNFGLEGNHQLLISAWQLNFGGDWVYRGADYSSKYGQHHRNDLSAFAQLKRTFFERLILTAGARQQFVLGESGTDDYDRFLPSFGAVFKATDNLNLFANAGKAFRAPTFNNLYYQSSFLVGNPDLKPEQGWTYETGVKYDASLIQARFSLFYMAYDDKIELDRSQGYPLTYFNAGSYDSQGVEWDLRLAPFLGWAGFVRNVSFSLAGYWADPKAEDTSGQDYQAGPKFQSSLGVTYLSEPITLDLNCQVLAERENDLDDYSVFNFYSKFKLWKGYLTFAVDNILDQEVQVSGDLSPDASNRYVYYDTGRLIKVGYQITF